MNARIRACRVLRGSERYKAAGGSDGSLFQFRDRWLGEPLGFYRNPGPDQSGIGVFSEWLVWSDRGRRLSVRFDDLMEVNLAAGKESEEILLRVAQGEILRLSARGRGEKFVDSLEFYRFLSRIL